MGLAGGLGAAAGAVGAVTAGALDAALPAPLDAVSDPRGSPERQEPSTQAPANSANGHRTRSPGLRSEAAASARKRLGLAGTKRLYLKAAHRTALATDRRPRLHPR